VSEILARVGDKWTVLIVGLLGGGPSGQQTAKSDRWHFAENADDNSAPHGARRFLHQDRISERSAARRIRADETRRDLLIPVNSAGGTGQSRTVSRLNALDDALMSATQLQARRLPPSQVACTVEKRPAWIAAFPF